VYRERNREREKEREKDPEKKGDFVEKRNPPIFFVSRNQTYALEADSARPIDYSVSDSRAVLMIFDERVY
jgi:hypothetical protein